MSQQDHDPQRKADKDTLSEKPDSSAGSQAATTGYGTGDSGSQATAPAQHGKDTPSNEGDAGTKADEAARLGDDRTQQMSHADGSNEADDPDV